MIELLLGIDLYGVLFGLFGGWVGYRITDYFDKDWEDEDWKNYRDADWEDEDSEYEPGADWDDVDLGSVFGGDWEDANDIVDWGSAFLSL